VSNNPYSPPYAEPRETTRPRIRPRPLVALALSLVALGSGYYYAGARWRLVWLAVAFPLLLAAIALLARFTVWIWAPFLLLTPFVCIDGLLQARRPDARRPPWLEM